MKTFGLAVLAAIGVCTHAHGVVISQWTFEINTPPDLPNSTTQTTAADFGSGTGTGVHASSATDWTTPAGNGSANSWSANTWGVNDYWQFQVSTTGFGNITVSFDQQSSPTGPTLFNFAYSTNGTSFTTFASNYSVSNTSAWSSQNFDLSSIGALGNSSTVYFRLLNQSNVATTGTSRIDNFTANGAAIAAGVPEPISGVMCLALAAAALAAAKHRFSRVRS